MQDQSHMPRTTNVPWLWMILAVAVGILTLRLTLLPPVRSQLGVQHPGVGKKMPELWLQPLTFAGDAISLEDLKGQVVVLNFWGTWCPPCQLELPHVAELARHYANDERCRVLAVSCGPQTGDPESLLPDLQLETTATLEAARLKLRTYADPDMRTRMALHESIGFESYPTTLVFDGDGIIRGVWDGYAPGDEKDIAELVESLLDNDA